jgi:hypothetical protein
MVAFLQSPTAAQEIRDGYWPRWGIQLEEMHQAVMADVFDHRSAQYRGLVLVPLDGGNILCGWASWRGDDGAFVPFVPFYYKALKGGVREAFLSDPEKDFSVPIALENAGCDPLQMLSLQRGHRLP